MEESKTNQGPELPGSEETPVLKQGQEDKIKIKELLNNPENWCPDRVTGSFYDGEKYVSMYSFVGAVETFCSEDRDKIFKQACEHLWPGQENTDSVRNRDKLLYWQYPQTHNRYSQEYSREYYNKHEEIMKLLDYLNI